MLPPPLDVPAVPQYTGRPENRTESCLLRPIRTAAAIAAPFESLGTLLSSHRAVARVSLTALSFIFIFTVSQQAPTQAGPEQTPLIPESLLPENVGVAVATDEPIVIPFDAAMDPAIVEATLQVLPQQRVELSWDDDRTALTIAPERLWRTDETYLLVIGPRSATESDEGVPAAKRYSFTTETAPVVADFQVRLAGADLEAARMALAASEPTSTGTLNVDAAAAAEGVPAEGPSQPPTETAEDVSATSSISIGFSREMDRGDVESHFTIAPEIEGDVSWSDGDLVFTPTERLVPGTRYTISVIGGHDAAGNVLGGKANFSFTVQAGAQLVRTEPKLGERDVDPTKVEMWFSQPMDVRSTNEALTVRDAADGSRVAGKATWNASETQLIFAPTEPFEAGKAFEVALAKGARDADGNAVTAQWSFATTAPAPLAEAEPAAPAAAATPAPAPAAPAAPAPRSTTSTRSAPAVPPPAPATSLAGYALNQVNAARAAYGFAPVVLDAAISAVAARHAMDQAANGYFSHTGLNGSTRESRLRAGGVSFGWSAENQCYRIGMSQRGTLDWCHAQFMAEPYPGQWNHIANILNPNARRMGVGIATVGGTTVITWNFTN